MNILIEFPPNIAEIRQYFPVDEFKPVFAYGDTIYNPFDLKIPADLEFHENVHRIQQQNYSSPDIWWQKYLIDIGFRLEQELEAYAKQYDFIKRHTPEKYYKLALEDFGEILASSMYGFELTKDQAKTLIRKYDKES